MVLAAILLLSVLVLGPTSNILMGYVENIGHYLSGLVHHATWVGESEAERNWLSGWTIFYWAWWIAWAPFVGMFIAKISYGRTVREFIVAVLMVPTLVGFAWLTIFGEAALFDLTREGSVLRRRLTLRCQPLSLHCFRPTRSEDCSQLSLSLRLSSFL